MVGEGNPPMNTVKIPILPDSSLGVRKTNLPNVVETESCKLAFRPFTKESYQNLLAEEEERKRVKDKIKSRGDRARLKDGELKIDSYKEEEDYLPDINPDLEHYTRLAEEYGTVPPFLLGIPLEEIDEGIKVRQKTFVVISKWMGQNYIYRFSASDSLFLLSPWNPIRRFTVFLSVNQYFDIFILLAIIINCFFMASLELRDNPYQETIFVSMFTAELVIKVFARGFIIGSYTYLRFPWNWLDLIVIVVAVPGLFSGNKSGFLQSLRTFRVLRALRTLSFSSGLKTLVDAILGSLVMLFEVILVILVSLFIFSLYGMESYKGTLRQKCVIDPASLPLPAGMSWGEFYAQVTKDPKNWYRDPQINEFRVCGNGTHAGPCPHGYICLPDIGDNPNFGFCNFDTIGWSMLQSFQLFTLDYWENTFIKVKSANGLWTLPYFIVIICFGSFYLLNVTLAVAAISYEKEAKKALKEQEKELAMEKRLKQKKIYKSVMRRLTVASLSPTVVHTGGEEENLTNRHEDGISRRSFVSPQKLLLVKWLAEAKRNEEQRRSEADVSKAVETLSKDESKNCSRMKRKPCSKSVVVTSRQVQGNQRPLDQVRQVDFRTHGLHPSSIQSKINFQLPLLAEFREETNSDDSNWEDEEKSFSRPGIVIQLVEVDESYVHKTMAREDDTWETKGPVLGSIEVVVPDGKKVCCVTKHLSHKHQVFKKSQRRHHAKHVSLGQKSRSSHCIRTRKKAVAYDRTEYGTDMKQNFVNTEIGTKSEEREATRKIFWSSPASQHGRCLEKISPCFNSTNPFPEDGDQEGGIIPQDTGEDSFSPTKKILHWKKKFDCKTGDFIFDTKADDKLDTCTADTFSCQDQINSSYNAVEMQEEKLPHMDYSREDERRGSEAGQKSMSGRRQSLKDDQEDSEDEQEDGEEASIGSVAQTEDSLKGNQDKKCPCLNYIYGCFLAGWHWLQKKANTLVTHLVFDIVINIWIVIYTVVLSTQHYGMNNFHKSLLDNTSFVALVVFSGEAVLKLLGLGYKKYFQNYWNIFDFCIVMISFVSVMLQVLRFNNVPGLLALRAFRLMRVLTLAKAWPPVYRLVHVIGSSVIGLGNLTIIFFIVLYIFAVAGFQLFYERYVPYKDSTRWSFVDFTHSFMMVFRIVCGEWIEPLMDCMRFGSHTLCMVVIFPPLIFGNFIVLNLSLALLLNSFGKHIHKVSHKTQDEKDYRKRIKDVCYTCCGVACRNKVASGVHKPSDQSLKREQTEALEKRDLREVPDRERGNLFLTDAVTNKSSDSSEWSSGSEKLESSGTDSDHKDQRHVEDSGTPSPEHYKGRCEDIWRRFRMFAAKIVRNIVYETIILLIIFASSAALAFDDYYLVENPFLEEVLHILNKVFCALFLLEMLLSWLAVGFYKYFTTPWTILDFIVAMVTLLNLILHYYSSKSLFKNSTIVRSVACLRALRPLRLISRFQGMKVVVNSLLMAIPAIMKVFIVTVVLWLLFSITGVQLFAGKFYKCVDDTGKRLSEKIVANRSHCLAQNYTWINSAINFDNVFDGFLALFQVATFAGWMEIMADAVDVTKVEQQPAYENSTSFYFYFVAFIMCGSFLSLNLVIGVIISNFNILKRKHEGTYAEILLSPIQLQFCQTLKKISYRKPLKSFPRPECWLLRLCFDLAVNPHFDMLVMAVVGVEVGLRATNSYKSSCQWTEILEMADISYSVFFLMEAIVKILGLGKYYFRVPWNVYDFVTTVLCVTDTMGKIYEIETDYRTHTLVSRYIDHAFLRVVRVFRLARVLRLCKIGKGARKLLSALVTSLPAVINISAILVVVVFIYAIFGVSFFSNVKLRGYLTEINNFRTFGNATLVLLTLATAANWNDILDVLMIEEPYCNSTHRVLTNGSIVESYNGDCGIKVLAIPYMISYILIAFLIIINMFIAVILETYEQAHEEEEAGVTEDDLDMFYHIWQMYDPKATQFIRYSQLSDFVADLEPPLGIDKPNEIALVSFNLPILHGNRMHCLDILLALVKNVMLGEVEESEEVARYLQKINVKFSEIFPTRHIMTPISTTMARKKEELAARTLQRAWTNFKTREAMKTLMLLTVRKNKQQATSSSNYILTRNINRLRASLAVAVNLHFKYLLAGEGADYFD